MAASRPADLQPDSNRHALIAAEGAQINAGGKRLPLPFYLSRIRAGFPSPADDYVSSSIDLNEVLIERPESTFFLRVEGDSMVEAGIHDGDVLVVDRAERPQSGNVVIAVLDGQLTVKRLEVRHGQAFLLPEHPDYPPIEVREGQDLVIWGVVQHAIHKVR